MELNHYLYSEPVYNGLYTVGTKNEAFCGALDVAATIAYSGVTCPDCRKEVGR